MFEISDRIVCINVKGLDEYSFLFTELPILGQMYVVRGMDFSEEALKPDGVPGVLLVGIFGGSKENGSEYCFNAKRFVPLDEYRKNRVSYLTGFKEQEYPEEAKELTEV